MFSLSKEFFGCADNVTWRPKSLWVRSVLASFWRRFSQKTAQGASLSLATAGHGARHQEEPAGRRVICYCSTVRGRSKRGQETHHCCQHAHKEAGAARCAPRMRDGCLLLPVHDSADDDATNACVCGVCCVCVCGRLRRHRQRACGKENKEEKGDAVPR
ncbi:hypothetical protein TW95_gp1185 [Pandoravirus inopinatum]|uniref:Uncharacterized protein n=1 Tax=Pandoravirus inopinatum TaxID=1605721 RepID=A0A0B5J2W1_9VIRU|nr:hypothetical protein TW95_gp1185 [Pandoravirus inopinatum]AJF97919.1 hypothetical protein [Pandoravirus inopinatum]